MGKSFIRPVERPRSAGAPEEGEEAATIVAVVATIVGEAAVAPTTTGRPQETAHHLMIVAATPALPVAVREVAAIPAGMTAMIPARTYATSPIRRPRPFVRRHPCYPILSRVRRVANTRR